MVIRRGRRPRRLLRAGIVGAVGAVVVAVGAAIPLFVEPSTDVPQSSDALVVLGPAKYPLPEALAIMDSGFADNLVIVSPTMSNGRWQVDLCNSMTPHPYTITCFSPEPSTTRGEARQIKALADENGWQSVMVLTETPHVFRARLIVERCYPGAVRMIEYRPSQTPIDWIDDVVYQYGALVKYALESGC